MVAVMEVAARRHVLPVLDPRGTGAVAILLEIGYAVAIEIQIGVGGIERVEERSVAQFVGVVDAVAV